MTDFQPQPEHKFTFGLWTSGIREPIHLARAVRKALVPG